jgi:AcrR family transcriptional regulator
LAINSGRRYAGLLEHERRADRRARLMRAGIELFGSAGFGKTTIPQLCGSANVAARHFYDEFASREELLKAIYDEIATSALEVVRAALIERDVPARQRIRAANQAYFTFMTEDPRRARIYVLESRGVSAELELHRRSTREAFVKLITPEQTRVVRPLDNRLLSVAVAAAAHGLLLEWVLASRRPPIGKMIDTITTIWIRTLKLEQGD